MKFARILPIALFPLLMARGAEAIIIPGPSCEIGSCGFTLDPALSCSEVPANYRIIMEVQCHDKIPAAAFPFLVDEAGQVVASRWQALGQEAYAEGRFELRSPDLIEGASYSIRALVPEQCPALHVRDSFEEFTLCPASDPESQACCAIYAEAGYQFAENASLDDSSSPDETSESGGLGGQGGAGAKGRSEYEYLRFVAGPPDFDPPAAPSLRADCEGTFNPEYFYSNFSFLNELDDDVRRLDLWLEEPEGSEIVLLRLLERNACLGEERVSLLSTGPDNTLWSSAGEWVVRAVAFDHAGNSSEEQVIQITVPEDCEEESVSLALPLRQCEGADYPVVAGCEIAAPVEAMESLDALCEGFQDLYSLSDDFTGLGGTFNLPLGPDEESEADPGVDSDGEPAPDAPLEPDGEAKAVGESAAPEEDGGCGCELSRSAPSPGGWIALLGAPLLFFVRRRRHSSGT